MNIKKLSQFRNEVYAEGSRPTLATLRKRIKAGKISGGFQDADKRYWVDMDKHETGKQSNKVLQDLMDDPLVRDALK